MKRLAIGVGTGFATAFVLIGGVTLQVTTTSDVAEANSKSDVIGGGLKSGSVPPQYAPWIEKAAGACPGLPAPVLAAQLKQESGFDPKAISPRVGAEGIAQFMPGTWKTWGTDADGDGTASPFDPPDAITAQGRFMCHLLKKAKRSGYLGEPIRLALAGYNTGWGNVMKFRGVPPKSWANGQTYDYVRIIMASAAKFTASRGTTGPVDLPAGFRLPADAPQQVRTAVAWALKQRGGWYQWGGTCEDAHSTVPKYRCDCSSLMQKAYEAAGVKITRTTWTQINEGRAVSIDAPQPGDLVFTPGSDGSASRPGHVGMYIGNNRIIEAPRTGVRTRLVSYNSWRHSRSEITRVVAVRRIVDW